MSNLKNAITKYCVQHNETRLYHLAEQIGISGLMLQKYMREEATPRDSTLKLIADFLHVDPETLRDTKEEFKLEDNPDEVSDESPEEETEDLKDESEEEPDDDSEDDNQQTTINIVIGNRTHEKPPIGAKPCFIAAAERIQDLADAISRCPSTFSFVKSWANEILLQVELVEKAERREDKE